MLTRYRTLMIIRFGIYPIQMAGIETIEESHILTVTNSWYDRSWFIYAHMYDSQLCCLVVLVQTYSEMSTMYSLCHSDIHELRTLSYPDGGYRNHIGEAHSYCYKLLV